MSFLHQPEAQSGFSGARTPKGREEGGAVDPWVSKTQVTAPFEPRRGRVPPQRIGAGDEAEDTGSPGEGGGDAEVLGAGEDSPGSRGHSAFTGHQSGGSGSARGDRGGPSRGGAQHGASRTVPWEGPGPTRGPRKGGRREHGLGPESHDLAQP